MVLPVGGRKPGIPDRTGFELNTIINRVAPASAGSAHQELRINADGDPFWAPAGFFSAEDFGATADGTTDNATAFAALATAVNAVPNTDGTPVAVRFPGNADGKTYRYSDGLAFTRPVVLFGTGGATLDYTGTGYAVQMGPDHLDDTNYFFHRDYSISNLRFVGGATFTHGIYFADHVTDPRLVDVTFEGFGNRTGWAVFLQADNWDTRLVGCKWVTSSADVTQGRNWIRAYGKHATSTGHASRVAGESDFGNTHLHMVNCHATNLNQGGGIGSGIGVWVDGANPTFEGTTLSGFEPCVRLGRWANRATFTDCYFETVRTNGSDGIIEYGDPADGDVPAAIVAGLRMTKCYFNVHNTDLIAIDAYPITYTQPLAGLSYAVFRDCWVTSLDPAREMVRLSNRSGNIGNAAYNVEGVAIVHTAGNQNPPWHVSTAGQHVVGAESDVNVSFRIRSFASTPKELGLLFENNQGSYRGGLIYSPGAGSVYLQNAHGTLRSVRLDSSGHLHVPGGVGFYGATPIGKPTITGSRSDGTALESLLTALSSMGMITDSTES